MTSNNLQMQNAAEATFFNILHQNKMICFDIFPHPSSKSNACCNASKTWIRISLHVRTYNLQFPTSGHCKWIAVLKRAGEQTDKRREERGLAEAHGASSGSLLHCGQVPRVTAKAIRSDISERGKSRAEQEGGNTKSTNKSEGGVTGTRRRRVEWGEERFLYISSQKAQL